MPLSQPPSSSPVPPPPPDALLGKVPQRACRGCSCPTWLRRLARWPRARVGCPLHCSPGTCSTSPGLGSALCSGGDPSSLVPRVCMPSAMCRAQGSPSPRHGRLAQHWTGCQPAARLLGAARALHTAAIGWRDRSVQTRPHSGCYQDCDVRRAGICSLPMKMTMTSASSRCGLVHWLGRSLLRKWERSS